MHRHWHIFKTYIGRWEFWVCLMIWASQFFAFAASSATRSADLLPFALGFSVLYGSAAIGVHVKSQLGAYRASLIPDFRRPHMVWAAIWLTLVILPFVPVAAIKSLSVLGVLALALIFSACAFAALCCGGWRSGLLAVLFVGIFAVPFGDHRLSLIEGDNPWLSIVLILVAGGWFARTFQFLATMTEETPGYESQYRGTMGSLRGPQKRRAEAESMRRLEKNHSLWLRLVDWTLPVKRVYVGHSRWRRILHWRRAYPNVWIMTLMPCLIWSLSTVIPFFMQGSTATPTSVFRAASWVVIVTPQIAFVNAWQARAGSIGRELAYPVRREDLILEQGIAVMLSQYLGWGLLMLEILVVTSLSATTHPSGHFRSLLMISGAWQLVALGLSARLASMRSAMPLILALMVNTAIGTGLLLLSMQFYSAVLVSYVTGGILLIGGAALFVAYQHWLSVDVP